MIPITPSTDGADLVRSLLAVPSERDKQRTIGASSFGSACDYCVAQDLVNGGGENEYALATSIGTAIHSHLEMLEEQHLENPIIEQKIVLGELDGYSVVSSKPDLVLPVPDTDEYWLIDHKGLPLDTPLPTPTGWTTMGEVKIGDALYDGLGKVTTVTAKSKIHHNPTYKITFDDATSVVCDIDHRWKVNVGLVAYSKDVVMSVREILARGLVGRNGQRDIRVVNHPGIETSHKDDLPIDPYVLGVWLGDGDSTGGRVCKPLAALWDEIQRRGYTVSHNHAKTDRAETRTVYGLRTKLREANLLGNKHIPAQYLRASYSQRLDLLRGLMDTDGHYNRKRKRVVMETTNKTQALYVRDLIVTFGWKASVIEHTTTWQGGTKPAWSVSFTPPEGVDVFLSRKPNNFVVSGGGTKTRRLIVSVEKVEMVPTQCISVASEDSTYLCTENMIPTHNTTQLKKLKEYRKAYETEEAEHEFATLTAARFTMHKYFGQLISYARGLHLAGINVQRMSMVFIPRDGKKLSDIQAFDFWYDQGYADRVWERLEALWQYIAEGGDVTQLTSAPGCFPCEVSGRV